METNLNQDFSRSMQPSKKKKAKNAFTLRPRLKKRLILRNRDNDQKFVKLIEELRS
jgi:hypothetical protein